MISKENISKHIKKEIQELEKEYGCREGIERIAIEETIRKIKLNIEIEEFKEKFRNRDIKHSPEAYCLFKIFGHSDINKLSLNGLLMLGFSSNLIVKKDLK